MTERVYCESNVLAKLIKAYILHNPYCTARDISRFLMDNRFGLGCDNTPHQIRSVIRKFNSVSDYRWFRVERVKVNGKPCRYVIKE